MPIDTQPAFPKELWELPGDMHTRDSHNKPFNWSAYVRLLKWEHEHLHRETKNAFCLHCVKEAESSRT